MLKRILNFILVVKLYLQRNFGECDLCCRYCCNLDDRFQWKMVLMLFNWREIFSIAQTRLIIDHLAGHNESLNQVCGQNRLMDPLPSINDVLSPRGLCRLNFCWISCSFCGSKHCKNHLVVLLNTRKRFQNPQVSPNSRKVGVLDSSETTPDAFAMSAQHC